MLNRVKGFAKIKKENITITTNQMKMDKESVGYYWKYAFCLQIRVLGNVLNLLANPKADHL